MKEVLIIFCVTLGATFLFITLFGSDFDYVPRKETHVYVCDNYETSRTNNCEHYTVKDKSIIEDSDDFEPKGYKNRGF